MYPDPEAQFYTYICMNNTMKPNQQFRNEGQYGLTTFVNFSFHFGSSIGPTQNEVVVGLANQSEKKNSQM